MSLRPLMALFAVSLVLTACASAPQPGTANGKAAANADVQAALAGSRLAGVAIGDRVDDVMAALSQVSGAVLVRQLAPSHAQVASSNLSLANNAKAMALIEAWDTTPGTAGQFIARLDHGNAAVQAWVTVCAGRVRGLQASYSPGAAVDAFTAWQQHFPRDTIEFPASVSVTESGQSEAPNGRRYTETREYLDEANRQRIHQSVRWFVPADPAVPPVAQLVTRIVEDMQTCP